VSSALAVPVPEVLFGVSQQSGRPGQVVAVEVTVSGFQAVSSAQTARATPRRAREKRIGMTCAL